MGERPFSEISLEMETITEKKHVFSKDIPQECGSELWVIHGKMFSVTAADTEIQDR